MKLKNGVRSSLMQIYGTGITASFVGTVRDMDKENILIKGLKVRVYDENGQVKDSREDHVWVANCKEIIKSGVQVGDRVRFSAEVYMYKRSNRTMDWGLKNPKGFTVTIHNTLQEAV